MVFCNMNNKKVNFVVEKVTILILIDGFLQSGCMGPTGLNTDRHNPYFNRWFSAIFLQGKTTLDKKQSQSLF